MATGPTTDYPLATGPTIQLGVQALASTAPIPRLEPGDRLTRAEFERRFDAMHDKLNVYRRSGVREYIVWRVLDRAIDWFVLREGEYVPLAAGEDGILRSDVFPGLWLNAPAMLEGRLDAVLATLHEGIATPAHQEFVAQLEARRQGGERVASERG